MPMLTSDEWERLDDWCHENDLDPADPRSAEDFADHLQDMAMSYYDNES
jgi:hypothetical protein